MKFRLATLFSAVVATAGFTALFANEPQGADFDLIERLNTVIQLRFLDPSPATLGMSRVARPASFGTHFFPVTGAATDFKPEQAAERSVVAELEARQTQVGFYLIGAAITESKPQDLNFRALKGPAAITRGTPRPSWYPGLPDSTNSDPGALPDWRAIYPLARQAMASFKDGGAGFETSLGSWTIAARPVIASQQRCVACHNNPAYRPVQLTKLDDVIGGVLYAYRRP